MRTHALTFHRAVAGAIPVARAVAGVMALTLIFADRPWVAAADPSAPAAAVKTGDSASKKTSPTASAKPRAVEKREQKKAPPRRLVTVGGNQITLDVRQWPLLGKPQAKRVLVEMFDYTCPYCRATHQALRGAMERFGDDLAVIALPVPLDAACNHAIQYTAPQHAEGCEIARIAVAVWRVDRRQFQPFHSWLFSAPDRRSAYEARQHAAELVGEKAIAEELNRPYAAQYIAKHVELYERIGSGSLPKLLFPNTMSSGAVESADTLIDMINREF